MEEEKDPISTLEEYLKILTLERVIMEEQVRIRELQILLQADEPKAPKKPRDGNSSNKKSETG